MIKKNFFTLCTALLLLSAPVRACKIDLEQSNSRPALNEETVLILEYQQTHRNCREPISSIKIEADGMTILGATDWEEIGKGTFQRKLKVKITEDDCSLQVTRSCPKGGLDEDLKVRVASED